MSRSRSRGRTPKKADVADPEKLWQKMRALAKAGELNTKKCTAKDLSNLLRLARESGEYDGRVTGSKPQLAAIAAEILAKPHTEKATTQQLPDDQGAKVTTDTLPDTGVEWEEEKGPHIVEKHTPPSPSKWKVVWKTGVFYRNSPDFWDSSDSIASCNDIVVVTKTTGGWLHCSNGKWLPSEDEGDLLVTMLPTRGRERLQTDPGAAVPRKASRTASPTTKAQSLHASELLDVVEQIQTQG